MCTPLMSSVELLSPGLPATGSLWLPCLLVQGCLPSGCLNCFTPGAWDGAVGKRGCSGALALALAFDFAFDFCFARGSKAAFVPPAGASPAASAWLVADAMFRSSSMAWSSMPSSSGGSSTVLSPSCSYPSSPSSSGTSSPSSSKSAGGSSPSPTSQTSSTSSTNSSCFPTNACKRFCRESSSSGVFATRPWTTGRALPLPVAARVCLELCEE
mmetsp:Transcript_77421/g.205538  ORF Transcript_77421/g.205538 Transcript_77421/m.205538 type:complete len:213 (-) Transcript_77421:82-720(-)